MKNLKILLEKDKTLRKKSKDVVFPLSNDIKNTIKDMIEYLKNTQREDIAEKYNLRPGMGLAAIQLGLDLNFFVVVLDREENADDFMEWIIINPKIISESKEMIYASGGEGCLSVTREVDEINMRHARLTVEYSDLEGVHQTVRVREEIAIAFQHELDHLNGILFTDTSIKLTDDIFDNYRSI